MSDPQQPPYARPGEQPAAEEARAAYPGFPPPAGYPAPQAPAPAPGAYAPPTSAMPVSYVDSSATSGLAVASLIVSILGFIWVLPVIGSLVGAILGHVALSRIKTNGGGGRGLALAGVIVGWIGFGLAVLAVIAFAALLAFAFAASSSTSFS